MCDVSRTTPILGPTLGGWITDNYSWRWIFYINIPVGAVAFLASYIVLDDPEYLKQERAELKKKPLQLDAIGLVLLVVAMVCWEVLLSKGQEWDWLGDPFWRVQTAMALFVLSLGSLVFRELRINNPVVNLRPLAERNFASASVIIFCAFGILYAASTILPGLLQSLFGYDATSSGLVMSPSGIFSVVMLPIVGFLLGRGTDARWLITAGILVMGFGNYWMSLNLEISPFLVVWPRVLLIIGLSLIFAPINVAAYMYTPRALRGAAVGLFALIRNEGGSVGTSLSQTLEIRRDQFHTLRVNKHLDPLNPTVNSFLEQAQAFFYRQTGDSALSQQMAWQSLSDLRDQQAASLAYFDVFRIAAILSALLVFLVFLMKRSVAEKGAHIAAEQVPLAERDLETTCCELGLCVLRRDIRPQPGGGGVRAAQIRLGIRWLTSVPNVHCG